MIKRFNTTKYGYKYDQIIFYSIIFILVSIFAVVYFNNDFKINENYIYYECKEEICNNPIKTLHCSNEKVWGKDCSIKCNASWCNETFLKKGIYGNKPPRIIEMFPFLSSVLIVIGFLLNHLLHNKGKDFELEIRITEKIRLNLKDIEWGKNED